MALSSEKELGWIVSDVHACGRLILRIELQVHVRRPSATPNENLWLVAVKWNVMLAEKKKWYSTYRCCIIFFSSSLEKNMTCTVHVEDKEYKTRVFHKLISYVCPALMNLYAPVYRWRPIDIGFRQEHAKCVSFCRGPFAKEALKQARSSDEKIFIFETLLRKKYAFAWKSSI